MGLMKKSTLLGEQSTHWNPALREERGKASSEIGELLHQTSRSTELEHKELM